MRSQWGFEKAIMGSKKNYTFFHLLSSLRWANNHTNRDRSTGENKNFNTCAWGILIRMKIPKTLRHHWVYMTFRDKGKGWVFRFQK